MTNSEIIGIVIVLFIYVIIGSIIARKTYSSIDINLMCVFAGEKIVSEDSIDFVRRNKVGISLAVGLLWMFYAAFSMWVEVGHEIYNEVIIDKDEESRIASWVV